MREKRASVPWKQTSAHSSRGPSAWAFFIDAISFLFIIGALWRLPDPPVAATGAPRRNMFRSILDGLHYVKSDIALTSLMLVVSVLNFAIAGPASIGIAIIAKQKFGSPLAFGLLMSALAAGGLTGTLLAGLTGQPAAAKRVSSTGFNK